jgi:hypothetical protein
VNEQRAQPLPHAPLVKTHGLPTAALRRLSKFRCSRRPTGLLDPCCSHIHFRSIDGRASLTAVAAADGEWPPARLLESPYQDGAHFDVTCQTRSRQASRHRHVHDGHTVTDAKRLPLNLLDALRALDKSSVLKSAFGEDVVASYIKLKTAEWHDYASHLTECGRQTMLDC